MGDGSFGFCEATALCLRKARGCIQADDIPLAENVIGKFFCFCILESPLPPLGNYANGGFPDAIEMRRRTLITGVFVFLDKVLRDAFSLTSLIT